MSRELLDRLNPSLSGRTAELRNRFRQAQPFPFVVIDHFLAPEFCDALIREFPAFDPKLALNERGEPGRKAVRQDLARLSVNYAAFDTLMSSADFLRLIGEITGIPELLYDPDYVGGGTHENLNGQNLDTHVDFNFHPKTRLHRRLNLILFLNPQWSDSWGGALELRAQPESTGNDVVRLTPEANRCVIFETSERSWHGFPRIDVPAERANVSRRSIAVYFYTRTRPADETAPSHGTFYFMDPLPEHIRTGHTLSTEDIDLLRCLIERRDTHVRYLYEREMEFSRIAQSPTYRAASMFARVIKRVLGRR
jgi:hypothetical protein